MTNMEDLQEQLDEKQRQDAAYADAVAKLNVQRTRESARGYAVMSAAMGYGEGALGDGTFAKISHLAKIFLIWFACAVPCFFVWAYLT